MTNEPTVFVVDDDEAIRGVLNWLMDSVGLKSESYASGQEFLTAYDPDRTGCLVLDVRMAGMSGLELQSALAQKSADLPIILLTGHGDVQMAVHAMKAGAFDFLEKPFNNQQLLDLVQKALHTHLDSRTGKERRDEIDALLLRLTPREREVFDRVVAGETNKLIAHHLGISIKTVETHRSRVMEKLAARSLADLIRMYGAAAASA